jgi:protein-tyrosine phosphatase
MRGPWAAAVPAVARPAILSPMRILFVCMGNICRSPTAEGVMRALLSDAGLDGRIEVDSAGTGGWHAGDPPDARAVEAARARGIALDGGARQVTAADFERFDLLLAMDRENARELRDRAPDEAARAKVRLLREFDPEAVAAGDLDVPDPYYGGPDGFERVLDLVQAACRGLLDEVRAA